MTIKDKNNIKRLYFFFNFNQSVIALLFGLGRSTVWGVIHEDKNMMASPFYECILCSNDDAMLYYIDGNENNQKPQNRIMLCEACKRRVVHLQLRRKKNKVVISQL